MTRQFVGPRWPDGTYYELAIPDDWISQEDNDGERKFISHRSPQGARLVLWIFRLPHTDRASADPNKNRAATPLERAYSSAKWHASSRHSGGSFLMWLVCVLLGPVGPRPTLRLENLGLCSGYAFRISSGKDAGWYGDFEVDSWWVRMALWTTLVNSEGEIDLARAVVSSLRFMKT